jgi:replicative DNA helicase
MKVRLVCLASVLALGACSSTAPTKSQDRDVTVTAPTVTAIANQALSSTFKRQGIKVEWDCSVFVPAVLCDKAKVTAIEVTAYATSNGSTEVMRENAFAMAEIAAKAKLRRFLHEDLTTYQVTNTLTKNIEKANDRVKQRMSAGEVIAITDDEATQEDKEQNYAQRQNVNESVRTVTENIRVNSKGILQGVRIVDEVIVGPQTVSVTLRWDQGSQRAADQLRAIWR